MASAIDSNCPYVASAIVSVCQGTASAIDSNCPYVASAIASVCQDTASAIVSDCPYVASAANSHRLAVLRCVAVFHKGFFVVHYAVIVPRVVQDIVFIIISDKEKAVLV